MNTNIGLFHMLITLTGIVLCALSLVQLIAGIQMKDVTRKRFIVFYICLFSFVLSNLAIQMMYGRPGGAVHAGMCLASFIEFCMPMLMIHIFSLHLLAINASERGVRLFRAVATGTIVLQILLAALSHVTGFYYFIDENNRFHRGSGFPLSFALTILLLTIDCILLIRGRKRMSARQRIAFWFCFLMPYGAMTLQMRVYGAYVIAFNVVFSALMVYVFLVSDQTVRYHDKERENIELKVDILLSQIQPHFLSNSLNVIKAICRSDPARAERAIDQFAEYLRHNMDSITNDTPIPFPEELRHTRCYLELQKLRFGDDLNVAFDLETTSFRLPTLTLQPLVENAVTYGVRRSENGCGTVTLRTREYPDRYEISVIDDGPGFEAAAPRDDRSHVGLDNVRERVRRICNGDVRIESTIGLGTNVTIILPRSHKEVG